MTIYIYTIFCVIFQIYFLLHVILNKALSCWILLFISLGDEGVRARYYM